MGEKQKYIISNKIYSNKNVWKVKKLALTQMLVAKIILIAYRASTWVKPESISNFQHFLRLQQLQVFTLINYKIASESMFCMGANDAYQTIEDPMAKKIQNYIFQYQDLLGKGNFGEAYRGFDVNTDKQVAIKVIKMSCVKSKTCQKLLENEIQILKNLSYHPNVLKCYDVLTSVNHCYIVTELCDQDLQKELRRRGRFKQNQIKLLVYGIYKGLEHLAKNYIVHRDIKISNIFLSKNKSPKIADFGFAIRANIPFKDVNIGSPIYMSPESLLYRQYGPKTDVWSFGVLLYELVYGQTPLQRCKTQQQLKNQILKPPIFPYPISNQLRQVIERCLTVDQIKRPDIFQLGNLAYFRNLLNQIESIYSFKKEKSNTSTQCSIKGTKPTKNPFFYTKNLSYDNGLSLLHYCRLLHKINLRYLKSKILSQFLINLSACLCQAQFSTSSLLNEQLNKLKEVLKKYNSKFQAQSENKNVFINPRQALAQIGCLMNQRICRSTIIALQVLDTQTKVLIYSLEHQNPDILTKNSEARVIIEKGAIVM